MTDTKHLADSEPWIVRNGIGVQIMETLAVGAFLTALAVQLGAPNWMIGALAAIPHIAQTAQLPALLTVERARQRKPIYLASGTVARPMLLVIALAAVTLPPAIAMWVILIAFLIRYLAGAFLSCSWNSWMRDLVPDAEMGRLFSHRQQKMIGVGIVCSILAAAFVDGWKALLDQPIEWAYAVVYVLAFIGGAYSVLCARKIHEPPMAPAQTKLLANITEPFNHVNYRKLIAFLGSWNFAVNLAAPFFTVFLLRRLEYDLVLVMILATTSQIAAFLTVRYWGAIADRFSNKAVLRTCCPIFILAIFAWTFLTLPTPHALTLPLLFVIHFAMGLSTAGVNLATGNIALKLAPVGNSTSYLAGSSMVNAIAAGIAALMGGITVDLLASWELGVTLHWQGSGNVGEIAAMHFSHWDFFFALSAVIGLYAMHRLSLVAEQGEVAEPRVREILTDSARQGLRNLSTIAGLRAASSFPMDQLLDSTAQEPDDQSAR